eukprot:scaffold44544_cov62-Attheya_sp.AAC.3
MSGDRYWPSVPLSKQQYSASLIVSTNHVQLNLDFPHPHPALQCPVVLLLRSEGHTDLEDSLSESSGSLSASDDLSSETTKGIRQRDDVHLAVIVLDGPLHIALLLYC